MSAIFFAEFALTLPSAGGVYGYLYAVWGEYPAWMGGWLTMIVFMNAVSSVASVGVPTSRGYWLALVLSCLKPSVDLSIPVKALT